MKAIQCELCGSSNLVKKGDYFVCQGCGTKYDPESTKKMFIDGVVQVEGTVKQDRSDEIASALELSESSLRGCNYADAEKYASRTLELDPNIASAWITKYIALSWLGTLNNDRNLEADDCLVKALSLIKAEADGAEEPAGLLKQLSRVENNIYKIMDPEIDLYTKPMENRPGAADSLTSIKTLLVHISAMKNQLKSIRRLEAQFAKPEAAEAESELVAQGSPNNGHPLSKSSYTETDSRLFLSAFASIYKAINKGAASFSEKWEESYDRFYYYYTSDNDSLIQQMKKKEIDSFDICTGVYDSCADALRLMDAVMAKSEPIKDWCLKDSEFARTVLRTRHITWSAICQIEKLNIEHHTVRTTESYYTSKKRVRGISFADEAVSLRKESLIRYERSRDSFDETVLRNKAIVKIMNQKYEEAWASHKLKQKSDELKETLDSLKDEARNLNNEKSKMRPLLDLIKERAIDTEIEANRNHAKEVEKELSAVELEFEAELRATIADQFDSETGSPEINKYNVILEELPPLVTGKVPTNRLQLARALREQCGMTDDQAVKTIQSIPCICMINATADSALALMEVASTSHASVTLMRR